MGLKQKARLVAGLFSLSCFKVIRGVKDFAVENGFGGANDTCKSNGNDSGRFGCAFAPAFGRAVAASRQLSFGTAEAVPLSKTDRTLFDMHPHLAGRPPVNIGTRRLKRTAQLRVFLNAVFHDVAESHLA